MRCMGGFRATEGLRVLAALAGVWGGGTAEAQLYVAPVAFAGLVSEASGAYTAASASADNLLPAAGRLLAASVLAPDGLATWRQMAHTGQFLSVWQRYLVTVYLAKRMLRQGALYGAKKDTGTS